MLQVALVNESCCSVMCYERDLLCRAGASFFSPLSEGESSYTALVEPNTRSKQTIFSHNDLAFLKSPVKDSFLTCYLPEL